MNRVLFCLILVVSAVVHSSASTPHPAAAQNVGISARTYDVPAFLRELQRISASLKRNPGTPQIAELRDALPKSWTVAASERTYSISTQPLRNFLTALDVEKSRAWVSRLSAEIRSFTLAPAPESTKARAELNRILARREFEAVHPPGAWELLRQRVIAWLERLLLLLFGGMARYPIGGKILFWLLVVGATLWIAVWLLRFWIGRERMQTLHSAAPLFRTQTWQEWLHDARHAAARGDFREAVHASYWAGIVRLQESGAIPKDRAKTPREYLRIASEPAPDELTSRTPVKEPLSVLTSRLERTWYANRAATLEDFQDNLRQLEALGCPLG
jgi:Domain of unknown function (DUF4129)